MGSRATDATFVTARELRGSPLLGLRPVRLSTGEALDQDGRPLAPGFEDQAGFFPPPWLRTSGSEREPEVTLELEALADAERPLGALVEPDVGFSEPSEPDAAMISRFEARWGSPSPPFPSPPERTGHLDGETIEVIATREGMAVGGDDYVVCMFKLLTEEWRSYTTSQVRTYTLRAKEMDVWYPPANIHHLFSRLTACDRQRGLKEKAALKPRFKPSGGED
jgi:hypothetical protein